MLKQEPTLINFAETIHMEFTTETPTEEKLKRQHTVARQLQYSPLSSLLAEIGQLTEQEDIDAIVRTMRICD